MKTSERCAQAHAESAAAKYDWAVARYQNDDFLYVDRQHNDCIILSKRMKSQRNCSTWKYRRSRQEDNWTHYGIVKTSSEVPNSTLNFVGWLL